MTKTRILVVEDEFITATDIRSSLEAMGYEVPAVADNGEGAISTAGRLLPSLVIMDIGLAGKMNGIEAGKQIRERFDIPVIFLTAHSDESTFWSALASEPFGYITKPFEAHELKYNIEMALQKHAKARGKGRGAAKIPAGWVKMLPLVLLLLGTLLVAAILAHPSGLAPPANGMAPVPLPGNSIPDQPGGTRYEKNVAIVREIARGYHETHTYLGVQNGQSTDVYVCIDMAKDVWNMIKTRGINAVIVIGNVKTTISTMSDVNHAWVIAEVGPMQWLAVETTSGYVVTREENPLYYTGMQFETPVDMREYSCGKGYCWSNTCVNDQCQECSTGFILGTDLQCYPACGSGYCTGNSVCADGQCLRCEKGQVVGTDTRCHPACIDSTHYCLEGFTCGPDNRCHPE
jgi:CheY-like chemotaxis protein